MLALLEVMCRNDNAGYHCHKPDSPQFETYTPRVLTGNPFSAKRGILPV
jgi:hypothetical protein